jgi:hypothetical protein
MANPLDVMSKAIGIGQGLNQMQLFEQKFKADKAMGPILQQSIDPQTGQVDYGKASMMMAVNPDTAFRAPEFAREALTRQQMQVETLGKMYDNAGKRIGAIAAMANKIAAYGPGGITKKHLMDGMSELVADGFITPLEATQWLAKAPPSADQKPGAGQDLHKMLASEAVRGMSAVDGLKATWGEIMPPIDTGGSVQVFRASPLNGVTPLSQIEKTPTVQDLNAPTPIETKGGTSIAPAADVRKFYGGLGTVVSEPGRGPTNPLQPGATPETPPGMDQPKEYIPPGRGNSAGSVLVKPAPGELEFQLKTKEGMAEYKKALDTNADLSVNVLKRVEEMEKAFTMVRAGGGTEVMVAGAKMLQAIPVPEKYEAQKQALLDKLVGGDLGAAQEIQKLAVRGAMEDLRQATGRGDPIAATEFQQFVKSNPNLDTDPRAIEKIFNFTRELAKLNLDKQQAFTAYSKTNNPIEDFPTEWSKELARNRRIKPEAATGVIKGSNIGKPADGAKKPSKSLKEIFGE